MYAVNLWGNEANFYEAKVRYHEVSFVVDYWLNDNISYNQTRVLSNYKVKNINKRDDWYNIGNVR